MSDETPPPKPSYDPGWNDPPTFNYSNAPPPTKTKLNLNKRVAFPIQSSSKSTQLPKVEKSGAGLPLPFAKVKQNVIPSNNEAPPKGESSLLLNNVTDEVTSNIPLQLPPPSMTAESKSSENNRELIDLSTTSEPDDQQNSHDYVMETLRGINKSLATTDSYKVDEIDKRLNILETMWSDGKIEEKLKILLGKTAEALKENQFHAAIELQRSIIIDHGSNVCAQWGPALRQLILLKESKIKPPLDEGLTDTTVVDEPKFINPLEDGTVGSSRGIGRVIHL